MLLGGYIGLEEQAALIILFNLQNSVGQVSVGLGLTAEVYTREGRPVGLLYIFGMVSMAGISLGLYLARFTLSSITRNPLAADLVLQAMGSMLIFACIEGARVVFGAILSGHGRSNIVALSNMFSIGISLSAACILTFAIEFGIEGFWFGLSFGQLIQVLLFAHLI